MNTVLYVCWEEGWIRENKLFQAIYMAAAYSKLALKLLFLFWVKNQN